LRSHPTAVSATTFSTDGFDTEDNVSCTLTFPSGIATAHLTWTAGARKVLYTLHGDRGAITVDDDVVTVLSRDHSGPPVDRAPTGATSVPSQWMDASHREWFAGLLDQFQGAIERGDFVSSDTVDAARCVRVISAVYASARSGSREVSIREPLVWRRPNGNRHVPARTLGRTTASRP
jgi:predicted dehydrogenase